MNDQQLVNSAFKAGVEKLDAPFDVYRLDCSPLIGHSNAMALRDALLRMPFKKKSCDLYSFSQSPDFFKLRKNQRPEQVLRFLDVLEAVKQEIAAYLGKRFNGVISVSCSKYDNGDYLLCHDDRVDDRSVAFIYYLNHEWLDEWGGTLDVYSVDSCNNAQVIVHSIKPEFNTLVFFPVGNKSYHQVAENVSTFSRVSINGWFHCDDLNWSAPDQLDERLSPFYLPIAISDAAQNTLKEMTFSSYLNDLVYREVIKEQFTTNGFIMCDNFFKPDVIDALSDEIFSNKLKWIVKGPLNKRCYKYLEHENLPFRVLFLFNMLKTDHMFQFIEDCTGFNAIGVSIEIQKWHGGHYIVAGGNDGTGQLNVINFYIFFSEYFNEDTSDDSGNLHYVFEDKESAVPKFGCKPLGNAFFLVHQDSNTDSYVKYCKKVEGHSWTVIVASYLIKNVSKIVVHKLDNSDLHNILMLPL